jgi:hypothetical protein
MAQQQQESSNFSVFGASKSLFPGFSFPKMRTTLVSAETSTDLVGVANFETGSKDGVWLAAYGHNKPNYRINGDEIVLPSEKSSKMEEFHLGAPLAGNKDFLMQKKDDGFGTCKEKPDEQLRWGVEKKNADRVACWNRHYVEDYNGEAWDQKRQRVDIPYYKRGSSSSGFMQLHMWDKLHETMNYWQKTAFITESLADSAKKGLAEPQEVVFYDSATNKPLFVAPRGRTWDEFVQESKKNERLSFRNEEVIQENVRALFDGALVSVDGTHLGHVKPMRDSGIVRYGVNISAVAGLPQKL